MRGNNKPVCVIVALLLGGCAEPPKEVKPQIRPVRYQEVQLSGGTRSRSFSGSIRARSESSLSFKVAGTIKRVAVEVGDRVKRGQLIAALIPTDYELQVQQAAQSLKRAEAEERRAAASHDRVRLLYENENASLNDLDAARAAAESAAAGVGAAAKSHEISRMQLGYATLWAPIEGVIATVLAEQSENVQPGQPVVTLTSGARAEVSVAVPEAWIARVRKDDVVEVTCDALPGQVLAGRVTEVGVTAGGMGTTFPVTLLLDEPQPGMRPGMTAEVLFRFAERSGGARMIVPPFAVGEDRGGRFVFVVEKRSDGLGVVNRRAVQIGEVTSDGLEVFSGLDEGQLLVTAGVSQIQDGMTVRVPTASP